VTPEYLAELLQALSDGRLHQKSAKRIFEETLESGLAPAGAIKREQESQVTDAGALRALVRKTLDDHPEEAAAWLNGKDKLAGFFAGKILHTLQGRVDPRSVMELLRQEWTTRTQAR
jgi:aspartyl-tRNA(Asn)/glutamyl-tRNA(Gln) amidotransferase subunit B